MVKKSYLAKKDKELKLEVIKKLNPKLYDKVEAGEMETQDAYVPTMMKMKYNKQSDKRNRRILQFG